MDALTAENHCLQAHVYNDHCARQFARSQLEEYRDFLSGVMEDKDVAREVQRLGEVEDEDDDDKLIADDEPQQDGLSEFSEEDEEEAEEAEMSE